MSKSTHTRRTGEQATPKSSHTKARIKAESYPNLIRSLKDPDLRKAFKHSIDNDLPTPAPVLNKIFEGSAQGIRTLYARHGDCRQVVGDPGLIDAEMAEYPIDKHLLNLIVRYADHCPEFARGFREGVAKARAAADAGILLPAGHGAAL